MAGLAVDNLIAFFEGRRRPLREPRGVGKIGVRCQAGLKALGFTERTRRDLRAA
jgi:hypothetical protein